jgi:hypothetical protein
MIVAVSLGVEAASGTPLKSGRRDARGFDLVLARGSLLICPSYVATRESVAPRRTRAVSDRAKVLLQLMLHASAQRHDAWMRC